MHALILSAELSTLPKEVNAYRTNALHSLLRRYGLAARKAFGRYNGIEENSFVIPVSPLTASSALELVLELARAFEQECILELQGTNGTLRAPNGAPTKSLTVVEESLQDYRPLVDHTAVPTNGRFLILRLE